MKKVVLLASLVFVVGIGCANLKSGSNATKVNQVKEAKSEEVKHPELTEQQKLIACSQCHMEVTPDIYNEWYNSVHGIANVKCFQCHGTFEDFHVTPKISSCEACHAKEVEKCYGKQSCWKCHPAHRCTVHR